MTHQNRVLPTGEIVAVAARGTLMGNRGILHDGQKQLGRARWRHKNWVCCELSFKKRHREVMRADCYTELFFLDEAVALAAGHRPCGECRRAHYLAFRAAWARAFGSNQSAVAMDHTLHDARVVPRKGVHARHEEMLSDLPDGTFVYGNGKSLLVLGNQLLSFSPEGYRAVQDRQSEGVVTVLTPRPVVAVLAAGYRPRLHPSAATARFQAEQTAISV